jgi:hypothetical protein
MPTSPFDGFRRVCADHKYAYAGSNTYSSYLSQKAFCQVVPLPETSYPESLAFIISKKHPLKGLINWR